MLIDTLLLRGPDAIAQVDVKQRVHRNQDLPALSRMAFGVAQAALRRMPEAGRAAMADLPNSYRQFIRDDDDGVVMTEAQEVAIVERPPMASQR